MSLPGENGQNLVEWRFRKEQERGKTVVFGRKLRVRTLQLKLSSIREQQKIVTLNSKDHVKGSCAYRKFTLCSFCFPEVFEKL